MKYAILLGLLVLSACDNGRSVVFVSTETRQEQLNIPNYLLTCPKVDVKIEPLPAIRTAKELADYANRLEITKEKLENALMLCDMRRQQLLVKLRG